MDTPDLFYVAERLWVLFAGLDFDPVTYGYLCPLS